jgi:HD-GYP domain-containing protein (c-di-GMP phosphodiesterase class II)
MVRVPNGFQAIPQQLEEQYLIAEGPTGRLQHLVTILAAAVDLPEQRVASLRLLARFHNLGREIPDRICSKSGSLTPGERTEMQRHCEIGCRIAQWTPDLASIADWILKHHEWWDGDGYPLGLKGREIPLECRIMAIAEAYEAMTSDRPYRKAMSGIEAVAELQRCAGTQFDPELVEKFVSLLGAGSSD